MTTTVDLNQLQKRADRAQQEYELHNLEYQRLAGDAAESLSDHAKSWTLSSYISDDGQRERAAELEAQQPSIRDNYLNAVAALRNAEAQR